MGSSRKRNSNSATRARPSKKSGKDASERKRQAEAILETARATEPARMSAVEPATTGKSISVSLETLQEIRKRLVTTRAVVISCAHALATYSADHIQLTLEDDVVKKLDCLELTLKLILDPTNPFRKKDANEAGGCS
jgi:hypothetical protein